MLLNNNYVALFSDHLAIQIFEYHIFSVTGSDDKTMKVWNLIDGSLVRTIEDLGDGACGLKLCCDEEYAVTTYEDGLVIVRIATGEIVHKIDAPNSGFANDQHTYTPCGTNECLIALFAKNTVFIYDVLTGELAFQMRCPYIGEKEKYDSSSIMCGKLNI